MFTLLPEHIKCRAELTCNCAQQHKRLSHLSARRAHCLVSSYTVSVLQGLQLLLLTALRSDTRY